MIRNLEGAFGRDRAVGSRLARSSLNRAVLAAAVAAIALVQMNVASPAHAQPSPAAAAEDTAEGVPQRRAEVRTLRECLMLAERNYPKVAEAQARLAAAQAQLTESKVAPYSEFSTTAGLAVAPTVRGTNVFSPDTDVAFKQDVGLAWQVGISGTIPIWTFGKLGHLQDAAESQVTLRKHEVRQSRNEVMLTVRRAYYGVLFARDAAILLQEVQRHIDKSLARMKEMVADGDGDEVALLKLQMYDAELRARESELRKEESIALTGLRFVTGAKGPLDVVDEPLPEPRHKLASLAYYQTVAGIHRPEVNQARAGMLARQAQVQYEQAKYLPDLGANLSLGYSQAPEVTDQRNPFVRDPGNYLTYGVAIGLRWKLDFWAQQARAAQAQAKLEEVRATLEFALGGIATEVQKAYAEAVDAEQRLAAFSDGATYARRWLIIVQQGLDIGAYDDEDLIAPAKEYALKRFSEMNATYDYNVALARLALATGWSAIADDMLSAPPAVAKE